MKPQERSYNIKGMDCADCAIRIEKAIAKLPGVELAQVSFATSKLKVMINTEPFDDKVIIKMIENLGYSVENDKSLKVVTLSIEGMDCADEQEIIAKKMKALPGIKDFETYLVTQQLKISYNPALVSVQDIIKAVAETGMKASLAKEEQVKGKGWYKEKRILLLFTCGFLILLAYIAGKVGTAE